MCVLLYYLSCLFSEFCDASAKAYAAIVYLRIESQMHEVSVQFLAAKTRVTPVVGTTIPRLELLSALLLSKLMSSVHAALEQELNLSDPLCFSDSKVALFWIQGTRHEWKQFVENRVNSIRRLIAPQHWKHCPGRENPADIPSRGMSVSELVDTPLDQCGFSQVEIGPRQKQCPLTQYQTNADVS